MACVVMEPALAALGRPVPFFILRCACGAAGMGVCTALLSCPELF
jgi:hypothetical protein